MRVTSVSFDAKKEKAELSVDLEGWSVDFNDPGAFAKSDVSGVSDVDRTGSALFQNFRAPRMQQLLYRLSTRRWRKIRSWFFSLPQSREKWLPFLPLRRGRRRVKASHYRPKDYHKLQKCHGNCCPSLSSLNTRPSSSWMVLSAGKLWLWTQVLSSQTSFKTNNHFDIF